MRFAALANAFGAATAISCLRWTETMTVRSVWHLICRSNTKRSTPQSATLGNIRRFRRLLRKFNPDALVTYNWGCDRMGDGQHPAALPATSTSRTASARRNAPAQIRRRVLTRRLVLARSTRGAAVAQPVADRHRGLAVGPAPRALRAKRYRPRSLRWPRDRSPPAMRPVIGTVAGLRAEKNLPRLLRAFRRVADAMPARLVIVGDGPERSALAALAERARACGERSGSPVISTIRRRSIARSTSSHYRPTPSRCRYR